MLKFFRRIRRKLLNEGNFKKYLTYAIGEILLVMVGILLALSVNSWNAQRIDLLKETKILNDLHRDFVANKKELMQKDQMREIILVSCAQIIEYIDE